MADVVVNIRGNTSELQNDLNQIGGQTPPSIPTGGSGQQVPPTGSQQIPSPQTPGGGTPAMPSYDRMAQDIRREILNRGVMMVPGSSNFNQFMNTIQQQQRTSGYQAIDDRYTQRVTATQAYYQQEQEKQLDALEDERREKLKGATTQSGEDRINARYDNKRQQLLDNIQIQQAQAFTQLQSERDSEKEQLDKDLTQVMKDLVDELKRGNPNSYLGQLRGQYREAIWKRDNAETEEEARAAAREAADIEQRMAKAMGRQNPLQRIGVGWGTFTSIAGVGMNAYENYLANTGRQIGVLGAAANGDAFGAMEQDLMRRKQNFAAWGGGIGGALGGIGGGIAAAFGSLGIGTGAGIAGGATLGMGIGSWLGSSAFELIHGNEANQVKLGSLWAQQEKRLQEFTQLAMMTKGTNMVSGEGSGDLNAVRNALLNELSYFYGSSGVSIYDLGYSSEQASKMIAQRLSQRGFINGREEIWRALNADALEKAFNMSNGSLGQLSTYDRYGNDANQDFTNLVVSLDRMKTLGMSNGQTLRANEFMSYQQQLLESQKSWMLNPDSNFASRQLLAAQSVYGNSLDSRGIQAISRMNEAITHPAEGISKVLTYDVIQNLFPETKGNLLAIRQKQFSDNPEDRAKIQKAMFDKLTSVYGDANTTSGYLALSQYTGIENPYELQRWVSRMQKGLPEVTKGDIREKTTPIKDYTQEISKQMLEYTDNTMKEISNELTGLRGVADTMLSTFKEQLREIVQELK